MSYRKIIFSVALIICTLMLTVSAFGAEFTPGSDTVCFVSNSGGADTNAGTTANAPFKTLSKAIACLREVGGGTIVICGEVKVTSSFAPGDVGGTVVFTSSYGGVDYAATKNAKMTIGASMAFNNDTFFENIHLSITASSLVFSGRCHNFGFGYGVNVTNDSDLDTFTYPQILGGWNGPATVAGSSIANDYTTLVYSGRWETVSGGHRRTSSAQAVADLSGDISVIIKGGIFDNHVYATGMNVHSGRVYMEISGGTFNGIVCPIKRLGTMPTDVSSKTDGKYSANILVRISGGNLASTSDKCFRLAESTISTTGITYPPMGDATVVVSGGSFSTDFTGYGMGGTSLIKYDPNVLPADKIKGFQAKSTSTTLSSSNTENATFDNPIGPLPDPYVIEKDGIYYYCYSAGVTVDGTAVAGLHVAAHGSIPFGTLSTQRRCVFNATMTDIANAKSEYWAPEIHYFDADTVGADNAGWYIYFAADNGSNISHRMYVLRATDRENPFSDYEMIGQITDSTNKWAIDGTVLTIGKTLYFVWSGWAGDTNVAQNIYIAQMSNPWTISSARTLLSAPEHSWETKDNPLVNEGPQIIQHGGTTHIIYSASGSWTQNYCYGALTLTGSNPLQASSWYKSPNALFSSGGGLYGTGHGTFVQDENSNWWMIYHANSSLEVPDGSSWWAERSTYAKKFSFTTKTLNGVSVSYPSFGTPSSAPQSITVRTADYHAEDAHKYSPYYTYDKGGVVEIARQCYICGEYDVKSVSFSSAPVFKLSADETSVKISWDKIEGATGYKIYRKAGSEESYSLLEEIPSASTVSYTDSGLENGTRYAYLMHVLYTDLAGKNHFKASGGAAVYTLPAAPEISISESDGNIVVTVSKASAGDGYKYYRSTDNEVWSLLLKTTDTSYTDTKVFAGTKYYYKASAYVSSTEGSKSSVVSYAITPVLSAVQNNNGDILLEASVAESGATYKYLRSTDNITWDTLASSDKNTYSDTTAEIGTTYYYKAELVKDGTAYASTEAITLVAAGEKLHFEVAAEGEMFDAVLERANGKSFTLFERVREDSNLSVLLPEITAEYTNAYAVVGDFIVKIEIENGRATLPSSTASAVVICSGELVAYGDATGDGTVNLADAIRILKSISNAQITMDTAAADANMDMKLTVADILVVLKSIVNQ